MHKKFRQYNLPAALSIIFEHMEILDPRIAAEVADKLLEIQAIRLQPEKPFTWASGWKSPIYCDNRLSLSYPEVRNLIRDQLVKSVRHFFPHAEACLLYTSDAADE